jgi:hypothetical protein
MFPKSLAIPGSQVNLDCHHPASWRPTHEAVELQEGSKEHGRSPMGHARLDDDCRCGVPNDLLERNEILRILNDGPTQQENPYEYFSA